MSRFKSIEQLNDRMPDAKVECSACGETFVTGPWDNVTEIPYHGRKLLVSMCPGCGLVDDPYTPPGATVYVEAKGWK